jgi:serine/threonine protein kinase/tetratricopeptide (TPR) repeat protein
MSGSSVDTSPSDATLPAPGFGLGHYRILRRLGAGGMGQVFAAQRSDVDEVVALKQISIIDPTLLYRFKQEFRSLADLSHPNLIRLGELVVLPTGLAFYTMELVAGEDLVRWVRRGTPAGTIPNLHRLVHAMRQLAAGVAHLHRASRVHRDLKPSNVLVTAEGRVVILDFGLVIELREHDARITATGQLVGTPAYMAPEQGTRSATGPAIDLYAFGVTLFECLTGCMPFIGSAIRVLVSKQHSPAPDPRELAEGIPDWLAQLCRALLDLEPSSRPTAEQIVGVLDEHVEAAPSIATSDEAPGAQLLGRDAELSVLEQAHAQVVSEGRAVAVRLRGPAGRGKSALVDHFLRTVRGRESVVLRGRCHPRESVPYKGIDSIVDALAVYLRSLVDAVQYRPRHVRELCELFPVLAGIWAEPGRRGIEHEPVARRRLGIGALREVLARIADEATLIMMIDDLQWADLDGYGVIEELLLPPEPPAMLLISIYDAGAAGPIVERIGQPDALRGARLIDLELAPLAESHALALARGLIDSRVVQDPDALAMQLVRDSGGEPLALVRGATAAKPIDASELADDESLRCIRSLGLDSRALLELATVAGEPLANELVCEVLDLDAARFETAARELVFAGMLGPIALESGGIIKLARSRIGELVRVEFDEVHQRRLHASLAGVLATKGADAERIAAHFEAGGDIDRSRTFVIAAAREAANALAFVRAERLYRRALELLRVHGAVDEAELRELKLALADQLSHLARGPEAGALYVEVANVSPPEQASKLRLRAAEEYAHSGWSHLALPLLRGLMREAGEPLPSSTLGAVFMFSRNRLRLWRLGRRVRLREPGDIAPEELAHFDLLYVVTVALGRSAIILGMVLLPRVVQLALALGEPTRIVCTLALNTTLLVSVGRFTAALAMLTELDDIAQRHDDPWARALAHVGWHFYYARFSQMELAEAHFAKAMSSFEERPGRNWAQGPACHTHALLLRKSGRYARMREALPGWISLLHDFGQRQHESLLLSEEVLALAQLGDCEVARRSLERARAGWQVEFNADYLLGVAEVWLLLAEGHTSEACERAHRTESDLRRHDHGRLKLPRMRVRETCLWASMLHAIATNDRAHAPPPRELRRLRRAGVPQYVPTAQILSAGRASLLGDRDRECKLWREALAACDALSMSGYAAAVSWRLAQCGPEDAAQLRERAQAYFATEKILEIEHFVALMAPAATKPSA